MLAQPLGRLLLAYLIGDVPEELRREVLQLELALERPDLSGLVLWDDFSRQSGHTIAALVMNTSRVARRPASAPTNFRTSGRPMPLSSA